MPRPRKKVVIEKNLGDSENIRIKDNSVARRRGTRGKNVTGSDEENNDSVKSAETSEEMNSVKNMGVKSRGKKTLKPVSNQNSESESSTSISNSETSRGRKSNRNSKANSQETMTKSLDEVKERRPKRGVKEIKSVTIEKSDKPESINIEVITDPNSVEKATKPKRGVTKVNSVAKEKNDQPKDFKAEEVIKPRRGVKEVDCDKPESDKNSQAQIVSGPRRSGRSKSTQKDSDIHENHSSDTITIVKKSPRKRKLSKIKIVDALESPMKKVRVEATASAAIGGRSSAVIKSPKRRFTSIASSIAKNGVVTQKNAPRKTLCNMDILGLLDDEVEAEEDININDKVAEKKDEEVDPEISFREQISVTNDDKKVPVWRRGEKSKVSEDVNVSKGVDVYDIPQEDFGPEDKNVGKKKAKRKKKDTKAILTFNDKVSKDVRNAVKESHNLLTPGLKKSRKPTNLRSKKPSKKDLLDLPPLVLSPQKPNVVVTNYDSEVSHGAQNYFDSVINPPVDQDNDRDRSGIFGNSLEIPSRNYKTPSIPKKLSRLHENSSTPTQKSKTPALSVKEQIKNNFGFDSEEDLSETESSMIISPVRKITNPVLAMMSKDRLSTASNISLPSQSAGGNVPIFSKSSSGPFRVNSAKPEIRREQKLFAEVKAIKAGLVKKKISSRRASPKKGLSNTFKGPIHCSTLLEDIGEAPKQRNIKEMLQSVNNIKKSTVNPSPVNESLSDSEASSLFEDVHDPPSQDDITGAADNEEETTNKIHDKENSDVNSPQKFQKPTVSRVYKRKNINNSTFASKPSTSASCDQSSNLQSPRKETKKDKKLNEWAKHQTSHFSEVDEFDLSFS